MTVKTFLKKVGQKCVDVRSPDNDCLSVQSPMQRGKKPEISIEMVKAVPDVLIQLFQTRVDVRPAFKPAQVIAHGQNTGIKFVVDDFYGHP